MALTYAPMLQAWLERDMKRIDGHEVGEAARDVVGLSSAPPLSTPPSLTIPALHPQSPQSCHLNQISL